MNNEIIVVKQLPIIQEQLQQIKEDVTGRVEKALSLVCTEDTVKDVKAERAALNKEFTEIEGKRKEVKKAILSPYEQFEAVYKDCVSDIYKAADSQLKTKIDAVEDELKNKKRAEVEAYFNEYLVAMNIDFVTFENSGINVTLSASLKSLKQQAETFIQKISDDLALIDTQDNKEEILYYYKKVDGGIFLNASKAITLVNEKYKAIEEEKARKAEQEAKKAAEAAAIAKVEEVTAPEPEPIAPPVEIENLVQMTFTVKGKLSDLKDLKQYIYEKGIEIL